MARTITTSKRVSKAGQSLGVYLTKELKLLGAKEGDVVTVIISMEGEE